MLSLSDTEMKQENSKDLLFDRKLVKRVIPNVKIRHDYMKPVICNSCNKKIKVNSYYCDIVTAYTNEDNLIVMNNYRFCKSCSGDVLEKLHVG